jgi:hypothetical protein
MIHIQDFMILYMYSQSHIIIPILRALKNSALGLVWASKSNDKKEGHLLNIS